MGNLSTTSKIVISSAGFVVLASVIFFFTKTRKEPEVPLLSSELREEKKDEDTLPLMSSNQIIEMKQPRYQLATFGAGCYWCVEAVYQQLKGVVKLSSGFMGGHVEDPSYKEVCSGETGHAEVVQVTYDPSVVSYDELLDWFWKLHDPTTLNRQGEDKGTQYRSAIFYHNEEQHQAALASMKKAQAKF